MIQPAIVISAYNRPAALARLLDALRQASYPPTAEVALHISIDYSEDPSAQAVQQLAREYDWPYGRKQVELHSRRLGLVGHFFYCGSLSSEYGSIIYLEDDLLLARQFYAFASQALDFYQDEPRLGGICLCALWFNGYTHFPFVPLLDESDAFFLQIPFYHGQAFTAGQWQAFLDWLAAGGRRPAAGDGLHESFLRFDQEDWFPLRTKYLVESGRYYLFPRQSQATGFGDAGVHFARATYFFQTPLQHFKTHYTFKPFAESLAVYDSFYEILPGRLNRLTDRLQGYDYCVDLYGTKSPANLDAPYVLTSRRTRAATLSFSKTMWPMEANLIAGLPGNEIWLSRKGDLRWGRLADLTITKSHYDYFSRRHPLPLRTLLQFKLMSLFNR